MRAAGGAVAASRPLAEEHGVEIVVTAPAAPLKVGVDETVVERILGPVLDNGIRYGRSHVWLHIGREGRWVTFRTSDDGPGIHDGEADRVFEPGARGAASAGSRGAGLGLALTRRLARAAGGEAVVADAGVVVRLPAAPGSYAS
jgi:signal transduction histidine kinase